MHEASIAQSIVETVLKNAQEQNANFVKSVELEVGQLTFLNIEQVSFWVQIGFENTVAEKADLKVRNILARFRCQQCGYEGPIQMQEDATMHFQTPIVTCTQCGEQNVEIIDGKDVVVRKIRIVQSNDEEE